MCVPPNDIRSVLEKSKGGRGMEVLVALFSVAVRKPRGEGTTGSVSLLLGPPPRWRPEVALTLCPIPFWLEFCHLIKISKLYSSFLLFIYFLFMIIFSKNNFLPFIFFGVFCCPFPNFFCWMLVSLISNFSFLT